MKSKPNIHEFLGGAPTDKTASNPEPTQTSSRITKTIRIAVDLDTALKETTHARWKETGKKVSESDLIDDALRKYLNI
jgi:hypothetical protein